MSFTYFHSTVEAVDQSLIAKLVTFLLLYNNLVPLSLYITLDLVKAGQCIFMHRDQNCVYHPRLKNMKNPEQNNLAPVGLTCRTSTLNDDLGQIDYVFTDKTGTLTENEMIFRVCSAGGETFGKT